MSYRPVDERFWRDDKVRALDPKAKLLFVYFITNPSAHYSGVYYIPLPTICFETGLSDGDVRKGIDTLSIGYMIAYEYPTNEVFVSNMAKFQTMNEKQKKGIDAHLYKSVQSHRLIKKFCDKYADFGIPYRYPIVPTETETDIETEIETHTETLSPEKSGKRVTYSEEFEKAWAEYEHKGSKGAAWTVWKTLTKEEHQAATVGISIYKTLTPEKQYRKDFERYLKARTWEDKQEEKPAPVEKDQHLDKFEELWACYRRPDSKGSKLLAQEEWLKLVDEQKKQAYLRVDDYLEATRESDGKYRANVDRYLRERLWEGLK